MNYLKKFAISYLPNFIIIKLRTVILKSKKIKNFKKYKEIFFDKNGIEIGGPSILFSTRIPIYQIVKNLDGINFSGETLWEKSLINNGRYFYYKNRVGTQYISEATDLMHIKSDSYDFLITSNCLEHVANPLKAIEEWLRVIKNQGDILLVVPNKKNNFDHKRKITKFEHLIEDYQKNVDEKDLTHLPEILKYHDIKRDSGVKNFNEFKVRCLNNFVLRGMHHHVFDDELLKKIYNYFNIELIDLFETNSDIIALGKVIK